MLMMLNRTNSQRCFRVKRNYLTLGLIGGGFSLIAGIVSVFTTIGSNDPAFSSPVLAIAIFCAFYGSMTLLGVYLVMAYVRYRLFVSIDAITEVGGFAKKTIQCSAVTAVIWRTLPKGGSVVIQTVEQKITLSFMNYPTEDRGELQAIVRERFDPDLQTGWQPYFEHFEQLEQNKAKATRGIVLLVCPIFVIVAALFIKAWLEGQGVFYLVLGLANVGVVLWLMGRSLLFAKRA